jgi:hypothetical protein
MKRTRAALLSALLTAVVFAAGQALAAVPNVELVTVLVFLAGYLLGPALGSLVGAAGMGAHSLFNVMGAVAPPVWAAQVLCYALVGAMGGVAGPPLARVRRRAPAALLAATIGAGLALFYQLSINAVTFFLFSSGVSVRVYLWGGIAFGAVQVAWNAAVFLFVPAMLRVLARHRRELAATP